MHKPLKICRCSWYMVILPKHARNRLLRSFLNFGWNNAHGKILLDVRDGRCMEEGKPCRWNERESNLWSNKRCQNVRIECLRRGPGAARTCPPFPGRRCLLDICISHINRISSMQLLDLDTWAHEMRFGPVFPCSKTWNTDSFFPRLNFVLCR